MNGSKMLVSRSAGMPAPSSEPEGDLGQFLEHVARVEGQLGDQRGQGAVFGFEIRRAAGAPIQIGGDVDVIEGDQGMLGSRAVAAGRHEQGLVIDGRLRHTFLASRVLPRAAGCHFRVWSM